MEREMRLLLHSSACRVLRIAGCPECREAQVQEGMALKSLDGREKGVLRAAFEDVLTPDVAWRKKSPYPKTFHPAYLARVVELLHDRMHRPGGQLRELVNEEAVGNLIRDPDALKEPWYGQLMRAPQVLAWLVMLDAWLERFAIELI